MSVAGRNAGAFYAGIAEEQSSHRRGRVNHRLLTLYVIDDPIQRICRRRLHIPTQTKIQSHAGMGLEIILDKERRVPGIGVTRYRGVLRDGTRNTDQEIGKRVSSRSC